MHAPFACDASDSALLVETLHGVTKELTFDATGPSRAIQAMDGTRRSASAAAKINRQHFGPAYMSDKLPGGDRVIGDAVAITLAIEMVQK